MTAEIRLDLLPGPVRARHFARVRVRLWGRLAGILSLVWLLGWASGVGADDELGVARATLAKLAARLDAEHKRDRQTRADVTKMRELWIRVEPALQTARSAPLFASAALAAPPEIKLARMEYDGAGVSQPLPAPSAPAAGARPAAAPTDAKRPPAARLALEGVAPQHEHVAHFLKNLETCGAFAAIRLIRADQAGAAQKDGLRFRVECEGRGGAP